LTRYRDYTDEYDDKLYATHLERMGRPRVLSRVRAQEIAQVVSPEIRSEAGFDPTYQGSRHEREWILTYLGRFYKEGWISDVIRQVKGGKEATVYCCRAHPSTGLDLIAAKLYRPRMFRNLRNDAQYRQGRPVLDADGKPITGQDWRMLKAIDQGSKKGSEGRQASWLAYEFSTLRSLHAAGGDVPQPLAHGSNTILMEYWGDEDTAAPTLNRVRLPAKEVRPLFERLMRNVDLMLGKGWIHGDLSAYNVLYWQGEVSIIDFPQVVSPQGNRDPFRLFSRDIERLFQYVERHGVSSAPLALAQEMWDRYAVEEEAELLEEIE